MGCWLIPVTVCFFQVLKLSRIVLLTHTCKKNLSIKSKIAYSKKDLVKRTQYLIAEPIAGRKEKHHHKSFKCMKLPIENKGATVCAVAERTNMFPTLCQILKALCSSPHSASVWPIQTGGTTAFGVRRF